MIKIDKLRLIFSILVGILFAVGLSYNSIAILFQSRNLEIDNTQDFSKLQHARKGSYVNITGTPNLLYSVEDGSSNQYFSLKEYGFDLIVKSNQKIDKSVRITFTGKVEQLNNIKGNEKLIERLNAPINTEEFEDYTFSEEQLEYIENKVKGDFGLDTYLLSYSSRSNQSTEIIVSELFLIFVLSTLGISSIIGGFRYEKIKKRAATTSRKAS